MSTATIPGYCTLCRSRCGTLNTVRDDRLIRVAPNPEHPTGRAICPKGRAAPELAHSTRRLQHPIRRTHPKGDPDPGWQEISWDEALDEISHRLATLRQQHGAETVAYAVTSPSGTPLSDSIEWIERFIKLFGSPNICYATEICNWHKDFAHAFTFGCGIGTPDYDNADLILLWGHNPSDTWLSRADAIGQARLRGARLMVVDPRRTGHAAQADHWLQVRPGTDAALALGLANLLIRQHGYDESFVRRWTNASFLVRTDTGRFLRESDLDPSGSPDRFVAWDQRAQCAVIQDNATDDVDAQALALTGEFRIAGHNGEIACRPAFSYYADACAPYTPERVSAITGIPEQQLRAAAETLMASNRVSYYTWSGLGQHTNATQSDRALAVLYALTGCIDAPGGNLLLDRQPVNTVNLRSLLPEHQRQKALGLRERPLGPPAQGWITARDLYNAVLDGDPYRVRAMIGFGANPLVSQAGTERAAAALKALEFHVHCDLFLTPTAEYADIVLPVNSPWEREGLRIGFEVDAGAEELVQLRRQMVPSQGESRSDNWIVFELAKRLGMGESFFDGDLEAGWNHILEPLGLTTEQLRRHPEGIRRPLAQRHRKYADRVDGGWRGFPTETGRVEIYSEQLHRHGYPPVPIHAPSPVETRHGTGNGSQYPFVLTTAKSGYYCHSQQRSLTSLRRRAADPLVTINPVLAQRQSLIEGAWVRVRTKTGEARFRARFDDTLHPEVVVAEYGWWQACPELGLEGSDPTRTDGSNFNRLIGLDAADPVSGSVPHRAYPCTVEPMPAEQCAMWSGYRRFRVAEPVPETADVRTLVLRPEDGEPLPAFRPGQYVDVRLTDPVGDAPLTRSYSLSGALQESEQREYRITVRRIVGDGPLDTPGAMSSHIVDRLASGDRVWLRAPDGTFTLPMEPDFPVVLVAGGIGITPFAGYLETLASRDSAARILLLYGNRDGDSHALRTRIETLAQRLPGLQVINCYSRPADTDHQGRDFDLPGRITVDRIDRTWIDARARFYLCGPAAMMDDLREGLTQRGVPAFEIFQELFRSPADLSAIAAGQPRRVRFARSNRESVWHPASGSLLDFAESHGVALPSGCRVGQCESCAVRILEGEIQHVSAVQVDGVDECLSCQAIPASDLVLDA